MFLIIINIDKELFKFMLVIKIINLNRSVKGLNYSLLI